MVGNERQEAHRVIGHRLFTDGIERDVYEDASGRQYAFGPDGEQVFGQWLLPADEPLVIGPGDEVAR
jgi:hypothetical protein